MADFLNLPSSEQIDTGKIDNDRYPKQFVLDDTDEQNPTAVMSVARVDTNGYDEESDTYKMQVVGSNFERLYQQDQYGRNIIHDQQSLNRVPLQPIDRWVGDSATLVVEAIDSHHKSTTLYKIGTTVSGLGVSAKPINNTSPSSTSYIPLNKRAKNITFSGFVWEVDNNNMFFQIRFRDVGGALVGSAIQSTRLTSGEEPKLVSVTALIPLNAVEVECRIAPNTGTVADWSYVTISDARVEFDEQSQFETKLLSLLSQISENTGDR